LNVLITGGCGFIGSHLVRALQMAGHAVRVLDVRAPDGERGHGSNVEFVHGSISDARRVARAMRDIEVVFHLAWASRTWHDDSGVHPLEERREIAENLLGMLNVLEAARTAGVHHLLFSGSAVVYGPTGAAQATEEHSCYPERSTIGGPMYGIAKLAAEKLCLVYQQRGLPVTVFRLHGVFAAGDLAHFGQMIRRARAGEPVQANREAGGEYIHLQDALGAFLLAMGNPRVWGQTLNLAGTHTYRDGELARTIIEAAGSSSPLVWIDDPTQAMVSVNVQKLRQVLGYQPEKGEFLTALIYEELRE
jgi:nucleoside-diphosphate-sugar epimerase